jgi:hypothetical protein
MSVEESMGQSNKIVALFGLVWSIELFCLTTAHRFSPEFMLFTIGDARKTGLLLPFVSKAPTALATNLCEFITTCTRLATRVEEPNYKTPRRAQTGEDLKTPYCCGAFKDFVCEVDIATVDFGLLNHS